MSLAIRVIPCLDVHDGRVVKGVNFRNLRDAGDPVDLAAAYGALANRGLYQKPSILRGYQVMDRYFYPREPAPPYRIISEQTADALVKMMVDVTENPEGTGRYVRIPGFHIAGKTGTAQKADPRTGAYARGKRIAKTRGAPLPVPKGADADAFTVELHERLVTLLDETLARYPDKPAGAWWIPQRLGGSAPSLTEAEAIEERVRRERAEKRAAENKGASAENPTAD